MSWHEDALLSRGYRYLRTGVDTALGHWSTTAFDRIKKHEIPLSG